MKLMGGRRTLRPPPPPPRFIMDGLGGRNSKGNVLLLLVRLQSAEEGSVVAFLGTSAKSCRGVKLRFR